MSNEGSLSLFEKIATRRDCVEAWTTTHGFFGSCPAQRYVLEGRSWLDAWTSSIASELSKPENPFVGWQRKIMLNYAGYSTIEELNSSLIWMRSGWVLECRGLVDGRLHIEYYPPDKCEIGIKDHLSLFEVMELVFLESLRQQLVQWSGLVCPFQQGKRTCCGFGTYLRTIWEHLPPEYRYPKSNFIHPETGEKLFFKTPPNACLNYGFR
jgi:hypothetical protein